MPAAFPVFSKWKAVLSLSVLAGSLFASAASARAEVDGRLGHTALPTVGRNTGISHVEMFPYIMIEDEQILFGDVRGFITNDGQLGGNFGGGFRFLEPNDIVILGVNGFYDVDQTTGELFQQVGFGLEALTRVGRITSNFYFPIGNDSKTLEEQRSNARFSGNQILFDNLIVHGEAMRGVDVTAGVYLPGDFAREHNMELSTGWYQFQGDNVENINGFKIQVDGEIVPSLEASVAVTSDDYFGPNATIGLSWRFGNRDVPDEGLEKQLRRFVDRNYNVVVGEWGQAGENLALINPLTGSEYVVQHVSSASLGGTGEFDSPFDSLADAQNAGGDILYVHSGTTLNESIVLQDGQMLLGGGTAHDIIDDIYGTVSLPQDSNGGGLPTLINSAVNAITMGNNSTVSGFNINTPNGDAIVANGIDNFTIRDITITNPNGDGVFINDSTNGVIDNLTINGGNSNGLRITNIDDIEDILEINDVFIDGVAGDGVHIDNGRGEIAFDGDLVINNAGGNSFFVTNLTTTTVTDDQGTTDTDDDVDTDYEGTVTVESLEINGATGGTGINVVDNDGLVWFRDVTVVTDGGSAVRARNTDRFFIGDGTLNSTNAAAVDIETSLIDLRLESITANGGVNGIRLVDTDGRLLVFGNGNDDSGGAINNTEVAVLMSGSEQIALQQMTFDGNELIADLDNVEHFEMNSATVTNTETQFVNALNAQTMLVTNSTFTDNDLTADTGVLFAVDTDDTFTTRFNGNTVEGDGPRRIFHAETLAGGEDSALVYSFQANDVELSKVNGVAAGFNWTGGIQAGLGNNLVHGLEDGATGFEFVAGDSADNALIDISQNGFAFEGDNSTGISIVSDAPMVAQMNLNLIQFRGLNGVGMDLTGNKVSTFNVNVNQIDDFAGGATGILFRSAFDGSTIALNRNQIDLSANDAFIDRGIVLQSVGGVDDPLVNFVSSASNAIFGASTTFSVPSGSTTGQVIINNQTIR
ncbi:hypothetical protein GYB59_01475 [bacterium]|nr:hypothetical protein [bacterium]